MKRDTHCECRRGRGLVWGPRWALASRKKKVVVSMWGTVRKNQRGPLRPSIEILELGVEVFVLNFAVRVMGCGP